MFARAWRYGDGDVALPKSRNVCFLSQRASLPTDTLKAVLAYPSPVDTYTDVQYATVLRAVGHMDELIDQLDTTAAWSKRLSPGQQ